MSANPAASPVKNQPSVNEMDTTPTRTDFSAVSRLYADIDLEAEGKACGFLRVPHSVHRSAYGWIPIPIVRIKNGDGPSVLMQAGNHGDEWEGQIGLGNLIRAIQPKDIKGRLVILPSANFPAAMEGRRTSPIELHVLDNERVLGSSTDGPIVAPAGRHEYEFVNSAIGYRVKRIVEIKAGQITPLTVTVPNGTLNINAVPWAAVWIDGASFGDTPLGNLSIAPGEHEILFRHPQLGERREKTIVRADAATRVTVNLSK